MTQSGKAATKSEIRISKSETIPNEKNSKFETTGRASLEDLSIRILHLFRASDFGFKEFARHDKISTDSSKKGSKAARPRPI